MKLNELKVERLKRELSNLELSATGTKNELQSRLMEELRHRGIDTDNYEFDNEAEPEVNAPATKNSMDINSLLAAIMKKMEAQHEKLMQKINVLADAQEASRADNKKLLAEFKVINKNTRAANDKLAEIYETVSKGIDSGNAREPGAKEAAEERPDAVTEDEIPAQNYESTYKRGEGFEASLRGVEKATKEKPDAIIEDVIPVENSAVQINFEAAHPEFVPSSNSSIEGRDRCKNDLKAQNKGEQEQKNKRSGERERGPDRSEYGSSDENGKCDSDRQSELLIACGKAIDKKFIFDNRQVRKDVTKDTVTAQSNDPKLTKTMAAKEEDRKCVAAKTPDEEPRYAEKHDDRDEILELVRARIKMVSERLKVNCDRAANTGSLRKVQLVPQWKEMRTRRRGPCKGNKRINEVNYRLQKHYDPRTKMKSFWQSIGEEVVSLFGTNRLKWAAVLRK